MPNVSTMSAGIPTAYGAEAQDITRRRRMAEALQQQSMEALPTNQMAGGYVVPISLTQGLAKMLQAYGGAKGMEQARKDEAGLATRRNQALADALRGMPKATTEDINPIKFDDEGNAMPPALKTTQPTTQDYTGWLGQLAQIGPDATNIGTTMLGMQQRSDEAQTARQARAEETRLAREGRMQELQMRLADARTTAQDRAQMQRELAQMQIDARRDIASMQTQTQREIASQNAALRRDIAGQGNRPPAGFRWKPDGTLEAIPGGPGDKGEKPLTEFQGKSTLYGTRAAQSDKVLLSLEDKISPTGLAVKQTVQNIPLIGGIAGAAGNALLSSEQQRVEQAQRDFVNAVLRQESGAVISDSEFKNAQRQYFPQPGDSKDVIAQKRANRQMAIQGFQRMAGPGGADIQGVRGAQLLPGQQPAPAANAGGFKILGVEGQ